jgi:hypothetical protein
MMMETGIYWILYSWPILFWITKKPVPDKPKNIITI